MAVTSHPSPTAGLGEVRVRNQQAAGLLKPSAIEPVLNTLEQRLVIRKLGTSSASFYWISAIA
jgi:mRNA interferase MazF